MMNIRNIRSIRPFLDQKSCKSLVVNLVLNQLDYSNAILYGLPDVEINRLQRIQNMAAKLVLGLRKFDSATAALRRLHWLPIRYRINFKIAVLVFKCVHVQAPQYLIDLLQPREPGRVSRSSLSDSETVVFEIPFHRRKTFQDRSFAFAGPTVWNALPTKIRACKTVKSFK